VPAAQDDLALSEQLARGGAAERLFARFDALRREQGWLARGGHIIDATVIAARRPRLSQAERDTIKGSGCPARPRRADHRHGPRVRQNRHGQSGL
jgi:transposase, IS5 family